jgi:hypothetical protein
MMNTESNTENTEGTVENGGRIPSGDAIRFMLAGKARFTLVSRKTGTRFTYQVRGLKGAEEGAGPWFVSILNGSDNESDYVYGGSVFADTRKGFVFRATKGSKVSSDAPSFKAFSWTFARLAEGAKLDDLVEVWHEGRCGRCGRVLTVPSSIASGLGPECAEKAAGA